VENAYEVQIVLPTGRLMATAFPTNKSQPGTRRGLFSMISGRCPDVRQDTY
jgi:hypothetical protein